MRISIVRNQRFPGSIGVFGKMLLDGGYFGVTCEHGQLLLPIGAYDLVPHDSPEHPDVVAFVNHNLGVFHQPGDVPEGFRGARVACLLHSANLPSQLRGCVAPGKMFAQFAADAIPGHPGGWGVTSSVAMMARLRSRWGDRKNLTAEIIEAL